MKKGCLITLTVAGLLIFISAALGIGAYLLAPAALSVTVHEDPAEITVAPGDSLHRVSEQLKEAGVIRSALWFRRKGQEEGIDRLIKPGTLVIEPGSHIDDVFEALTIDRQQREQVRVTFPEGFTLYQMARRLEEREIVDAEEFLEATRRYHAAGDYSFDASQLYFPLEGYLFPDTYQFEVDATADEIVAVMARQMEKVLTPEWRQRAEEMGYTTHQLLTLASLIEKEAFGDHERPTIAGVVYNRLEIDMLLQFCSSVLYGLDDGQELATRLLYRDLEEPHPFNTYKYKGLPPGPIANPGRASIEAALYPEDNDYLYFVVGDGGHNFSREYRDHLQNVEAYRNRSDE
ncbi:endolytic transglycosylase MltG [Anoxynatronum sibiricum]|uniref:Endolytic murein transglycosylase n=1 Tax=Anoxynatronum sibiricum TaxID=210623 RepID=A0ABU9VSP4_9CLOT